MQLNNEFKLLLTIGDFVEDEGKRIPSLMSVNQFSMIEMLGNTTRRKWSWTILTLIGSLLHFVRVALYRFRIAQRAHRLSDSDQPRDNTVQEVLTPQFAYNIETIMAIMNTNNDFPVQIGGQ